MPRASVDPLRFAVVRGGGRPDIKWVEGELPSIIDQAEAALIAADEGIYQRGGQLVRITRQRMPSIRNYQRPVGTLGMFPLEKNYMVEAMTRAAEWLKYDKRLSDWKQCNAPEAAALGYLARSGQWTVPHLWAVLTAPTLRPDGSVLQAAGYDSKMCVWYDPAPSRFANVPDKPTRDDAVSALRLLRGALSTLPFAGPVDEAVAVALCLTACVRRSLPEAPLGGITAPVMGTGKSLLADAVSILAMGVTAPVMSYPETDEEAAKVALSVLMAGDPVTLIDNIERPLEGDWLCSMLTAETYRARLLGKNELMTVPTATLWLATGNQLSIAGDLRTRALLCRLDAGVERPEERQFATGLRELFTVERERLVVACLTIMRAFVVSGLSGPSVVPAWGRFEKWSNMVRAPLVWLDLADPCASRLMLEEDDPKLQEHQQMIAAWLSAFGTGERTARQCVDISELPTTDEERYLRDIVDTIARERGGKLSVLRLGRYLRSNVGRVCGGHKFERRKDRNAVAHWYLKPVV